MLLQLTFNHVSCKLVAFCYLTLNECVVDGLDPMNGLGDAMSDCCCCYC